MIRKVAISPGSLAALLPALLGDAALPESCGMELSVGIGIRDEIAVY